MSTIVKKRRVPWVKIVRNDHKSTDGQILLFDNIAAVKVVLEENPSYCAVGVQLHEDGGRKFVVAKNSERMVDLLTSTSGDQFEFLHRFSIKTYANEIFKAGWWTRMFLDIDAKSNTKIPDQKKRVAAVIAALLAFIDMVGCYPSYEQTRFIVLSASTDLIVSYHVVFPELIYENIGMVAALISDFVEFYKTGCDFPKDLLAKHGVPPNWRELVNFGGIFPLDTQVYVPYKTLRLPAMYKMAENFRAIRPVVLDCQLTSPRYRQIEHKPRAMQFLGSVQLGIAVERCSTLFDEPQFVPLLDPVDATFKLSANSRGTGSVLKAPEDATEKLLQCIYKETQLHNFWEYDRIKHIPKYGVYWEVQATTSNPQFCPRKYLVQFGQLANKQCRTIEAIPESGTSNPNYQHDKGNFKIKLNAEGYVKVGCFNSFCVCAWDDKKKYVSLGKNPEVVKLMVELGLKPEEKKKEPSSAAIIPEATTHAATAPTQQSPANITKPPIKSNIQKSAPSAPKRPVVNFDLSFEAKLARKEFKSSSSKFRRKR